MRFRRNWQRLSKIGTRMTLITRVFTDFFPKKNRGPFTLLKVPLFFLFFPRTTERRSVESHTARICFFNIAICFILGIILRGVTKIKAVARISNNGFHVQRNAVPLTLRVNGTAFRCTSMQNHQPLNFFQTTTS